MYALMAVVFVLGYLCIAFEHPLKIDKERAKLAEAEQAKAKLQEQRDRIATL